MSEYCALQGHWEVSRAIRLLLFLSCYKWHSHSFLLLRTPDEESCFLGTLHEVFKIKGYAKYNRKVGSGGGFDRQLGRIDGLT